MVEKRLDTFVDFSDLYTSFLFNMLSNSLQIKTIATNINIYSDGSKWPELAGEVAKLVRIMLDFESSNAAALNGTQKAPGDMTLRQKLSAKKPIVDNLIKKVMGLKVKTNSWDTATFGLMDVFNIPLGIIEGALGAIKSKEANFLCSRNTTAARKNLEAMVGRL